MLICLVGPMASGKTEALSIFRELGAEIIESDHMARKVVAPGSPVLAQLAQEFGEDILLPDGQLDRSRLAHLIFSQEEKRRKLNSIILPPIIEIIDLEVRRLRGTGRTIVLEAPLLFETGYENNCDYIVCVDADDEFRLRRLIQKTGLSEEEACLRIRGQNLQIPAHKVDFVIKNEGDREELVREVKRVWDEFARRSRKESQ
ncbi:dephospho-CoA kinase [Candidatus Hakubella thermalkaliphila]|uniref:Dephospho-CoA kinase n=1 Tax=Candidatus Hakubella thermalkaliphila TaxID=2754717 RepID=A0A6V8Q9W3_9ACTN|nr:dephospho-CoA kinase [Candidatus Hakubella thermalkaliphila]GFP31032.1 dephospho-CoA kinase [Candidatus Hakubella thermalkaliphila]GFP39671.1 dephospho-CoA kinase [Candidatus Hakubella thermalkaliphila]